MTKRKVSRKPANRSRPAVGRQRKPADSCPPHGGAHAETPVDAAERRLAERAGFGRAEFTDAFVKVITSHITDPEAQAYLLRAEAKRLEREAERLLPPKPATIEAPPWQLTGAAFDGTSELREDATPADLFALLWHYPDVDDGDITTAALKSAADDMEIIGAALASGHDVSEPLQGFMLRAEWGLRVAREVHRRINAAKTAGGAA